MRRSKQAGGVFLLGVRFRPVFAHLTNISSIYGYRGVFIITGFPLPFLVN